MIRFSDSLPIQFWNFGLPTHNETDFSGIDNACYIHKLNLEDTCILQFADSDTTKNYSLLIRDKDGTQLNRVDFNKEIIYSGNAVYYMSFLYQDAIVVTGYVQFFIVETENLSNIIASSDFHDLQEYHDDTRLIKYSNVNDFEYLTYVGVSTVPTFEIRIFSKFYEWRFPEENESEKLGDGTVVKLSGSVSSQKLLEVEPVPPYMHKKLKLILQQNTIEIENLAWLKEENYETAKLNDRFGLFSGKVFLTPKTDEYITNV